MTNQDNNILDDSSMVAEATLFTVMELFGLNASFLILKER